MNCIFLAFLQNFLYEHLAVLFSRLCSVKLLFPLLFFASVLGNFYGQTHRSFIFEWDLENEAFLLDGENSPTLVLFEHVYYTFESRGGGFTITDQNNSIYDESEIFQNSVNGAGEYILFIPDETTPRNLKYQNQDFPSNQGNLIIQPFEQKGLLKSEGTTSGAKLGSSIAVANDGNIFAGAPEFNNNEGLIHKFIQIEDGNYSIDGNITSPVLGSFFWGSSLFYDNNTSNLLIGLPNANNYQGALYHYSLSEDNLRKITDGSGVGKMHGWSSFLTSEKTFVGELSVLDSDGGSVSIYRSSASSPELVEVLKSSVSQFGNEYGYSLHSFNGYLLVGAPGEDDLVREDSGAVYLHQLLEGASPCIKILPNNRNDGARFGEVVWMTENFIFIAAPNGDGSSPKSGVVHVYSYDKENFSVDEVFQILPPVDGSSLKFGQNILVQGDFVFIAAPGSLEDGAVYVFKRLDQSYSWKHVNSIPLDQFSDSLSLPDKIGLATNNGVLAIGLERESSSDIDAGAVVVLYNPAWTFPEVIQLHPFFENNGIIEINATEDQVNPVSIDFNASNPAIFSNEVFWDLRSLDPRIPEGNFEINSSTGNFIFYLPQNLSGISHFEITLNNGVQEFIHSFQVNIQEVQDIPVFLDFDLSSEPIALPKSAVNESYNYFFNTFDADEDSLSISLSSGQLPNGLSIGVDSLSLEGNPSSEGNSTFSLILTDGYSQIEQSFRIEVFSENLAPEVLFDGNPITIAEGLSLEFSENFSLANWQEKMSSLTVVDHDSEIISVEVLSYPTNGYLLVSEYFDTFEENLIRYTPKFNFNGSDSFSLRFKDNHPAVPKYFDLSFNLSIESLNTPPFVTSEDPPNLVVEGQYFEHTFDIFDAEEDYYDVSFQNLPNWISFDGVRRIYGKPTQIDYSEDVAPFFISVSDQWGNTYTKKMQIGIIPNNYPPSLNYLDEKVSILSFQLEEDGNPIEFALTADDPDDLNTSMTWQVSEQPQHGEILISNTGPSSASFSYIPDGNFSGQDSIKILVTEEQDSLAYDQIEIEFHVAPSSDAPRFESIPFPGLVANKPWIYEIRGIDGDPNDNLTLQSQINLPDWLKLAPTGFRTWTFRGQPTTIGEVVQVSLRLSDQTYSVDQNFSLKVLESVDDLHFTDTDEITFTHHPNSPDIYVNLNIDEDSNWSATKLAVNANNDVKVSWEIVQNPVNGIFSFDRSNNGEITNLSYNPNKHYFGTDKIILRASDNYSSARAEIEFHIQSVEDPHFFSEFPNELIEDENEKYDFIITYDDGDGLHTLNDLDFTGLPNWLEVETLSISQFTKSIRLWGEPTIDDIGVFPTSVSLIDQAGQVLQEDFTIKVNFYNKPPVPHPSSISASFIEDTYNQDFPKKWINFFSASDEETTSNELIWSIVSSPLHGIARINESGSETLYYPDANYSGSDFFSIGVMDRGANNASPRQVIIPVSIDILQENDLPVFQTIPPSLSSNQYATQWNDEKSYRYEVSVLDSDWPWQGYPSLTLRSSLPAWAKWEDLGKGKAVLSGSPQWFHQGNYSFSIVASSGSDEVVQNFDLEIFVDDYPPRVQDSQDQLIYKKIQIFVLEDGNLDDVKNMVLGLRAYNPDKAAGETLRWLPYQPPLSGGQISLTSYLDDDKHYARISNFDYQIPANFYGIDRFSLIADEGDRQTEVPFEINIKAIPDPPAFLETGPIIISVEPGNYFDRLILVTDPDGQSIDFKLLYPSNDAKWMSIKSENNDADEPSVRIGGIVPQDFTSQSYTLIASDPTGRFSLMEINFTTSP